MGTVAPLIYSTDEITSLLGYKNRRNILIRAKREKWKSQVRQEQGGGNLWLLNSMPKETRERILYGLSRRDIEQDQGVQKSSAICNANGTEIAETASKEPILHENDGKIALFDTNPAFPASASQKDREIAAARLGLINEIERMSPIAGREKTIQRLVTGSEFRDLKETTLALIPVAMGKSCEKTTLTRRTLYRWLADFEKDGPAGLLPKKPKEKGDPDWLETFLKYYGKPQHPTVAMAYSSFLCEWAGKKPSIHQVRRQITMMSERRKAAGRELGNALLRLRPYKRRDTRELWPGDIYTADGTTFDAEVLHPSHGQPFKPEITAVLDVATRLCVGFSISLSENRWTILDALRIACCTSGIPAMFYTDNGPGYDNNLLKDLQVGMFTRLGITPCNAIPGRPQGKGVMERAVQTLWVTAAQGLESYTGALMDPDAARANFKKSRKAIKEGKRAVLPTFSEFRDHIVARVEVYNTTPHRGLPRYRDFNGVWQHYSPRQYWETFVQRGWQKVAVPKGLEIELFRPGEMRMVRNCWLTMFGGKYFSELLDDYHGKKVEARYDVFDPSKVWCWTSDGRYICEAELDGNTIPYFPKSVVEAAREKREKAQVKRIEQKLEKIVPGATISVPENHTETIEVFASIEREAVEAASIELPPQDSAANDAVYQDEVIRPRIFEAPFEKYRWLMRHPEMQEPNDLVFLAEYRKGEEYADMKDLLEVEGIA